MAHQALHYRYHPLHQDIICAETAIASLPATVDALGASRDLDDGVKVNHGQFGDLLADVKAVTGGNEEP
jgi:hypothetical protein